MSYLLRVAHRGTWILVDNGERVTDVPFALASSRPDPITRAWDAVQGGVRNMPAPPAGCLQVPSEPKARGIRSLISWLGQQVVRIGRIHG